MISAAPFVDKPIEPELHGFNSNSNALNFANQFLLKPRFPHFQCCFSLYLVFFTEDKSGEFGPISFDKMFDSLGFDSIVA